MSKEFALQNSTDDYCFDPCQDCTEGEWGRVAVSGKMCQPRIEQELCKLSAKVIINVSDILESVSCGAAEYDVDRNITCGFSMNINGTDNKVLQFIDQLTAGTTFIIALSFALTAIGGSSLIARLVFIRQGYNNIVKWWSRNIFRDVLTGQFSWTSIIITACLPLAIDFDYAEWGSAVPSIVVRAKTFVLDWFVSCSDDGEPQWIFSATIMLWIFTIGAVALRIVTFILSRIRANLNQTAVNVITIIQSVFGSFGFVLIPVAGYLTAFLNTTSGAGYISLLCILLLLIFQPIMDAPLFFRIGASIFNVALIVGLCAFAGLGAPFGSLLAYAVVCAFVLPISDIIVLCVTLFRHGDRHIRALRHSVGWTISIRVVSIVCGLAFLLMLSSGLTESQSVSAAALWFIWIVLPYLSVIPLTFGVAPVLEAKRKADEYARAREEEEKLRVELEDTDDEKYRLVQLQQDNTDLEERNKQLSDQVEQNHEAMASYQATIAGLQEKVDIDDSRAEEIERLNKRIAELEGSLAKYSSKAADKINRAVEDIQKEDDTFSSKGATKLADSLNALAKAAKSKRRDDVIESARVVKDRLDAFRRELEERIRKCQDDKFHGDMKGCSDALERCTKTMVSLTAWMERSLAEGSAEDGEYNSENLEPLFKEIKVTTAEALRVVAVAEMRVKNPQE